MLVEGYWFDDTNLTGGANFPNALTKHAKTIVHQIIKSSCETKRRMQEIEVNKGWTTQIDIAWDTGWKLSFQNKFA